MKISHDSVNRFLLREEYTPHDLFNEVHTDLNLKEGTHGGAGQRPVPALRVGARDCRPLEHRVAVFAGLFAAV